MSERDRRIRDIYNIQYLTLKHRIAKKKEQGGESQ